MAECAGTFHLLALLGGRRGRLGTQGVRESKVGCKIKIHKFLSCPAAWAIPAFLPPAIGFRTFLDFNRSRMLQTLNFFVPCLC